MSLLAELQTELTALRDNDRLAEFNAVQSRSGARIAYKGRTLVDFSNWDYLGLATDPKLCKAHYREVEESGISHGAARLSSGTTQAHLRAEKRIAQFLGSEAACFFSSKNQAVLSIVSALVREQDVVVFDQTVQSPIADAAHVVNAAVVTHDLGDTERLGRELGKLNSYARKFLFIESLSPVTATEVDLTTLHALCVKHAVELVVDESYALAALGQRGAGGSERLGPKNKAFCSYSSMSYGLASYGAFVAGSRLLVDYLINCSSTFRREPALPSAYAAVLTAAIDQIELAPALREQIGMFALRLREGLYQMSLVKNAQFSALPIVTVWLASKRKADQFVTALFEKGFLAESIAPGLVGREAGVVRFLINRHHSDEDIDELLAAISDVRGRV